MASSRAEARLRHQLPNRARTPAKKTIPLQSQHRETLKTRGAKRPRAAYHRDGAGRSHATSPLYLHISLWRREFSDGRIDSLEISGELETRHLRFAYTLLFRMRGAHHPSQTYFSCARGGASTSPRFIKQRRECSSVRESKVPFDPARLSRGASTARSLPLVYRFSTARA